MLTDRSAHATAVAHEVASRGFNGLFLAEHTHMPVADQSDSATEIPEQYRRLLDPYVALAVVAATSSLDIGTCVSLVGQHDPLVLAKTIATLDLLSEGRFTLGMGFGWHVAEFEGHGFPAARRVAVTREKLDLMTRLWADDVVSADGEFVHLRPSHGGPRPASRPRPAVLLGASASTANAQFIAANADGWIPPIDSLLSDGFAQSLSQMIEPWISAGRDPAAFQVMALHRATDLDGLPSALTRAAESRIDRLVVTVMTEDLGQLCRILDRVAELAVRRAT